MVHQHICARFIDQHICAILVFLADFQDQLDSHLSFHFLFRCAGVEGGFVYKALLFLQTKSQPPRPLPVSQNTDCLPTTPTACPPHLQVARYTYCLPTTPAARPPRPPHLLLAPTYSLPTTSTACPQHLQLAHHTYRECRCSSRAGIGGLRNTRTQAS